MHQQLFMSCTLTLQMVLCMDPVDLDMSQVTVTALGVIVLCIHTLQPYSIGRLGWCSFEFCFLGCAAESCL